MARFRMQKSRVATGLGALVLLGSTVVLQGGPAGAAFPGGNGKIACASNRTGNFEVFTFDSTGTELNATNITNNAASDSRPRYRSDGRKIVFESGRNGGTDLYVADADGSNVQRITFTGDAGSGAWHPDGSQIVYQRTISGLSFEVYKVNIDGTGVTSLASSPAEDSLPFWNPDGTAIAFSSRRTDPAADVHTMDSFGNGVVDITNNPGEDSWPNWSPDGTQIAFHSRRDDATGEEIYRMPVTGGAPTRLTNNVGPFDIFPAWSPDGSRIVFNSDRMGSGFGEVWTMSATAGDAGGLVRITNNAATDQRCDWQPLCTIYGSGNIQGTPGDDIICGSEGADNIAGLGGNDIIYGYGGNDQISGGDGNDRIFGGLGNDSIFGGAGADFLSGGPGDDRFSAETADRLDVGAGANNVCAINGALAACPSPLS